MKELINTLANEFSDKEYAHSYMEAHLVTRIAAQIYALRKQRGWSQKDLAQKSGVAQERISKIESEDFDSLTIKTLQKFSRAFDVNLMVSFQNFSTGICDVTTLSQEKLKVGNRTSDLQTLIKNNRPVDFAITTQVFIPPNTTVTTGATHIPSTFNDSRVTT